jgi:hypothetical protein
MKLLQHFAIAIAIAIIIIVVAIAVASHPSAGTSIRFTTGTIIGF